MDKDMNYCGLGKLKDYPFLYFFNFAKPLDTVCVKECPKFDYNRLMGKNSSAQMDYSQFIALKNLKFDLSLSTKGKIGHTGLILEMMMRILSASGTVTLKGRCKNQPSKNTSQSSDLSASKMVILNSAAQTPRKIHTCTILRGCSRNYASPKNQNLRNCFLKSQDIIGSPEL